jgi:hypothetical protein
LRPGSEVLHVGHGQRAAQVPRLGDFH